MRTAIDAGPEMDPANVSTALKEKLDALLFAVEEVLDADALTLVGPITHGVEYKVRTAIENIDGRRTKLAVILHTGGGVVEVVERMVTIIRHHYGEVVFVVPDLALSAGTIFVMSGDTIMMDYASCLGPIDPQVERDGKLVPARSYLVQYERLIEKAKNNTLTEAEFAILARFDLAELHSYEMASNLSTDLIKTWLPMYKFKDWATTETNGHPVDHAMRERRAKEIAAALMNNERWGSHARGISARVLRDDLNLKIDDLGADPEVLRHVRRYFGFALDFCTLSKISHLAHSRGFL